jgi:hypothetical protein
MLFVRAFWSILVKKTVGLFDSYDRKNEGIEKLRIAMTCLLESYGKETYGNWYKWYWLFDGSIGNT